MLLILVETEENYPKRGLSQYIYQEETWIILMT